MEYNKVDRAKLEKYLASEDLTDIYKDIDSIKHNIEKMVSCKIVFFSLNEYPLNNHIIIIVGTEDSVHRFSILNGKYKKENAL